MRNHQEIDDKCFDSSGIFMRLNFKHQFKRNWLVLLPVTSAAASFILSFWLKVILTPEAYGDFATIFFTLNVLLGLGVVGYDQVVIKLSKVSENGLEIDRWILTIGILILALTPILSFAFLSVFGVVNEFTWSYLLLSWSAACIAILAILYNLQGRLLESYLILGSWKVVLLAAFAFLYLLNFKIDDVGSLVMIALLSSFLWLLIFKRKIFNLSSFGIEAKPVILLYFYSFLSLFSYKLFDSLDRFLLISNFDKVVFGDYFFVLNFLLAPTSIFVSYYTVRRLKRYKVKFNYSVMALDYTKVMLFSFFSASCLIASLYIMKLMGYVNYPSVSSSAMIMIALLCVTKNGYSVLSSAYKVVASKSTLLIVAIVFAVVSIFVYLAATFFVVDISLLDIVFVIWTLWVVRIVFYFFIIKRDCV